MRVNLLHMTFELLASHTMISLTGRGEPGDKATKHTEKLTKRLE